MANKTPDEIKKEMQDGIDYAFTIDDDDDGCPGEVSVCSISPEELAEALALIQQLEEKYERAMENAKILSDAVTQLERERDAAVEMLRRSSHCCESCKYMPISECVCTSEPKADGSCWEWRGLPEV